MKTFFKITATILLSIMLISSLYQTIDLILVLIKLNTIEMNNHLIQAIQHNVLIPQIQEQLFYSVVWVGMLSGLVYWLNFDYVNAMINKMKKW